jgi:photosystem II stability/assembly factor-like uncharacterized protein
MADIFVNSGENSNNVVVPTPLLSGIFIQGIDNPYAVDGFGEVTPLGGGATVRNYSDYMTSAEGVQQSSILSDLSQALIPSQLGGDSYDFEGLVGPQGPPGRDGTTLIIHQWEGINSSYVSKITGNIDQINDLGTAADKLVYTESYDTYTVPHWIERRPSGDVNKLWRAVDCDSDASNLIVAIYSEGTTGALFTSSDSGANWTERDPTGGSPLYYQGVASDDDGSHLVAVGAYTVYTSSNSGVDWTERDPAGSTQNWTSVDTDSDGSFIIAGCYSGVYKSSDSGANWSDITPIGAGSGSSWYVKCDSTGTYLIACYNYRVYTSSNGGSSWSQRDVTQEANEENNSYLSVDINSDGTLMIVASAGDGSPVNGRLFISTDYGVNWTEKQPNGDTDNYWYFAASNSDGTHLLVGIYNGRIYLSDDSGDTWTETQPAGATNKLWYAAALDSDGDKAIVSSYSSSSGRVYTYYETSYQEATWAESELTSAGRGLLDDVDAAAQATTLGLGTGDSPEFTGVTLSGLSEASIPFIGAGGVLSEDNTNLTWNDSTKVLALAGMLDASAGKVLVTDNDSVAPTSEPDGYIGVAKIGANARIYFAVDGSMFYTSGSFDVAVQTGNPIGLGLLFTYP